MNVVAIKVMNVNTDTIREILQMFSVLAEGLSSPFMAAMSIFMEANVLPLQNLHNTRDRVIFRGAEAY